ncbi:hypothetical protein [Clavibacter zhangzhiyongii]|uniref:hypothetical protein n=1 Tax=Clavibacter zhangzhiyongii TaxID=2768071 RepID=UPI0039E18237
MPRRVRPPVVGSVLDQQADVGSGVSASLRQMLDDEESRWRQRRRALLAQDVRTPADEEELTELDRLHVQRKERRKAASKAGKVWSAYTDAETHARLKQLIADQEARNARILAETREGFSPTTAAERTTSEAHGVAALVQADQDRKARLGKKKRSRSTIRHTH